MSSSIKQVASGAAVQNGLTVNVIGRGINGDAITYELMKHRKKITRINLIGPKDRKNGGTDAAPGMKNVETEAVDKDVTHPILSRSLRFKNYARSLLNKRAEDLERSTGIPIPRTDTTFLLDHGLSELRTRNFNAAKKASDFLGNKHTPVDPEQFLRDNPIYQPVSGLLPKQVERFDNEGSVYPPAMLEAYEQVFAKRKNVQTIDAYVSEISWTYQGNADENPDNRKATGVVLDDGRTIEADITILANGSWATETLAASGLDDLTQKVFQSLFD